MPEEGSLGPARRFPVLARMTGSRAGDNKVRHPENPSPPGLPLAKAVMGIDLAQNLTDCHIHRPALDSATSRQTIALHLEVSLSFTTLSSGFTAFVFATMGRKPNREPRPPIHCDTATLRRCGSGVFPCDRCLFASSPIDRLMRLTTTNLLQR
jgi:hypothetical protein